MNDSTNGHAELPSDVVAAIRSGHTIKAIKLLREARGMGLYEAKEAVDAYARGNAAAVQTATSDGLPAEVVAAIQSGRKIHAIKLLREVRGIGLKEAKHAVEAYMQANPSPIQPSSNSGGALIYIALFLAIAYVAYQFFGS